MWLTLATWLTGSKAGRIAGVVLLSLALVGVGFVLAFKRGAAAERAAQAGAALDRIRKRVAVDDEISRLSPAERRDRLMRWARDG